MKRHERRVLLLLTCVMLLASSAPSVRAQWVGQGTGICTALGDQTDTEITSDGEGGAIVAWADGRSGGKGIYVQRVDASGAVTWSVDGVALYIGPGHTPRIVSDGAGGAVVLWSISPSFETDIYAQRVGASGAVQWTADGVPLCTHTGDVSEAEITSDGAGGAIVAWKDYRNGGIDIYAQRVNSSGTTTWEADGVALCTHAGDQIAPEITYDDSGGAIVTWMDTRNADEDIYAQRVDASGVVKWTADGLPLCTATARQWMPRIVSDDAGAAIITWSDRRTGEWDIFAQRATKSGNIGSDPVAQS